MRREARRILDETLAGVGVVTSDVQEVPAPTVNTKAGPTVVHRRRSLSDDEMRLLSADWLAIPARDEFSPAGLLAVALDAGIDPL